MICYRLWNYCLGIFLMHSYYYYLLVVMINCAAKNNLHRSVIVIHIICKDDDDSDIITYHFMSQRWVFTHSSSALSNAGIPRLQLSSCLLACVKEDSI
ncbi:unnamed protein product [Musa hybrid cultivar]